MPQMNRAREDVRDAQDRLIESAQVPVSARHLGLKNGTELQLLETGDGEPALLLHGGGTSAVQMLPLMEHLEGKRVIAVDRPGFGLSDAMSYEPSEFRRAVVELLVALLDALELPSVDLVGNSMGGVWGMWLAIDRPERVRRLVLVGAVPLLPGAIVPLPLRIMTVPGVGELMGMMPPSPSMIRQIMGAFGEGDTIGNYPTQIDAMVAAGRDPIAGKAGLRETRAIVGPMGVRSHAVFQTGELESIAHEVLMAWGERDPIMPVDVMRSVAAHFARGKLELLPTGHLPWLGEPERTAQAIASFLSS